MGPEQSPSLAAGIGVGKDGFAFVKTSTLREDTLNFRSNEERSLSEHQYMEQLNFHSMHHHHRQRAPAPAGRRSRPYSILIAFAVFFTLVLGSGRLHDARVPSINALVMRQAASNSSVLDVFQVYPPVSTPSNPKCVQTLMVHVFANSYGQPFIGEFCKKIAVPRLVPCVSGVLVCVYDAARHSHTLPPYPVLFFAVDEPSLSFRGWKEHIVSLKWKFDVNYLEFAPF
jgi:hypothetical protein